MYFNDQFDDSNYDITIPKLKNLLTKFPSLKMVLMHGFWPRYWTGQAPRDIWQTAVSLVAEHWILLEILTAPGFITSKPEFPDLFRKMLSHLDADKFVWGSELAGQESDSNEYQNRRHHLEKYCGFLSQPELDLIMGENLRKMFVP